MSVPTRGTTAPLLRGKEPTRLPVILNAPDVCASRPWGLQGQSLLQTFAPNMAGLGGLGSTPGAIALMWHLPTPMPDPGWLAGCAGPCAHGACCPPVVPGLGAPWGRVQSF